LSVWALLPDLNKLDWIGLDWIIIVNKGTDFVV